MNRVVNVKLAVVGFLDGIRLTPEQQLAQFR